MIQVYEYMEEDMKDNNLVFRSRKAFRIFSHQLALADFPIIEKKKKKKKIWENKGYLCLYCVGWGTLEG